MIPSRPRAAATWSGVAPSAFFAFGFAPRRSSSHAADWFPSSIATKSAFASCA